MRVHGRLSGIRRTPVGLGLAVVAMVWALSVISPGAAGASTGTSPGASHGGRAEPALSGIGTSLSEAPPGLRAAVQRTFGSGGPSIPGLKQQAELSASDAASGNYFGWSVAVSGSTAVVGAPFRNSVTGAAYIFVRSGTKWSQQAELTASDAASGAEFGVSVAISGSTVLVGANGHSLSSGSAYVFVRSGTKWSQQAELTASDAAENDDFGYSVALSVTAKGTTAVIGALYHNMATGAAYVFVQSGTTWTQQAELSASDGTQGDSFGWSVAISGSTALVSAAGRNSQTGAAYVFVRSGTTWTQQAELTASDGASGDYFGLKVALSGSTALVGAPFHNASTGAAYAFVRSGTTWTQQAELTASNAPGGGFGYSVALVGSTAVLGDLYHHSSTGAVYMFVRSGTTWSQRAKLTASDAVSGDTFGFSVALSGLTAVGGTPYHNSNTGAAYVFRLP